MKTKTIDIVKAIFFVLYAVVLPVVALVVELTTQICADDLSYNPIPTLPHIIVVALIPALLLLWGLQRKRTKDAANPIWRMTLGAIASISVIYAIPMVPILPFALIVTVVGIGFLPFAPVGTAVIAFIAIWKSRKTALGLYPDTTPQRASKLPWGIFGLVIGFSIMSILSISEVRTQDALKLAQSSEKSDRIEAISILRKMPNIDVKNAACNYRRVRGPNPLSPFQSAINFENRFNSGFRYDPKLYWQVTGEGCSGNYWGRNARFVRSRDDRPGLSLSDSRFDTSIDARAATAYTEWAFAIKNDDSFQREADFIVQIPPDSVVSRVTLWVHGEPREATFAGRGKATAAYKAVVRKARDPILVSEIGPNKIRIRMFPVPVGKTMKARIGLTTPLGLSRKAGNTLTFPKIISANLSHDITHRVWAESKDSLTSEGIQTTYEDKVYQTRGDISDAELANLSIKTPFFDTDSISKRKSLFTTQTISTHDPKKKNLIFLIDGSIRMKDAVDEIKSAFEYLENAGQVSLLFIDDEGISVAIDKAAWSAKTREDVKNSLSKFKFVGGRDSSSALEEVQQFSKNADDIIVWIHAGQKITFGSILLPTRFETPLLDLQIDGERDINLESIYLSGKLEAIPRRSTVSSDLKSYFTSLSSPTLVREIVFGIGTDENLTDPRWHKTSDHLSRLGARNEVNRLLRLGKRDEAIKLAHENQIVTRVSAAVVLETADQYERHGLDQANGMGVPTVPEPEEWALMIIGAFFLLVVLWRKRNEDDFSQRPIT